MRNNCLSESGKPIHWEGFEKWLLDAVCISTIGDCMPLHGENRAFVHYGLRVLNKTRRKGLQRLMQNITSRFGKPGVATPDTIGFYIGPRINAAGRMAHAMSAFELMTTTSDQVADEKALFLEEKNTLTTLLVARNGFLAERRDLGRKFIQAHTELTQWIHDHPKEAQAMVSAELTMQMHHKFSEEILQRSWQRLCFTNEVSLASMEKFVADARKVGFLKDNVPLNRLIEIP